MANNRGSGMSRLPAVEPLVSDVPGRQRAAADGDPGPRRLDNFLQSLVGALPNPSCGIGGDGDVACINAAWSDYAGGQPFSPRRDWTQLIDPDDRGEVRRRLESADALAYVEVDCRLLDRNGASRWFRLSLQPVRTAGCSDIRWLCTAADIDELKRSEQALAERVLLLAGMVDASADCIKLIAPDCTLLDINDTGCRALGIDRRSGIGKDWTLLLPPDVRVSAVRALAVARAGTPARFAGRSGRGAKLRFWDNALTPVADELGRTTAIVCVSRDVTAERHAREALRVSEERLTLAARVGGLGVWDYDIANDTLYCDDTWHRILGRDAGSVRSVTQFRPLIHPEDVERATEVVDTAAELIASGRDYCTEYRIIRPDGEIRWVRSTACLITDSAETAVRATGFIVDVTDSRREEMALRHAKVTLEEEQAALAKQILQDPLTGIANRRMLDQELERICFEANKTRHPVTVGMVDVDLFKEFNDHYGHVEGDAALRKIAATLRSVFRHSDLVARYGGEEFAFVLADGADPSPMLDRLDAALVELDIPHAGSSHGQVTVSCGCVTFRPHRELTPTQLLKECDDALYEAKEKGRNRAVVRVETL